MQDRATTYKGVNLSNNDSIELLKVLFTTFGPHGDTRAYGDVRVAKRYCDVMPFRDFCEQVAEKKLPVANGKAESFTVYGMVINWFAGDRTSFTVEAEEIVLSEAQLMTMSHAIERDRVVNYEPPESSIEYDFENGEQHE